MENKEFQFKTTLNCGGCVSKVKSDLDNAAGISRWDVDTENADKILTVSSNGITEDEVVDIIKSKGFKAEPIA
ncbi:MAG TPA: heavy-metal-associated domain-containing protein [Parapedobacter sp.]|nr:heavy-metal-associated domain-containing protein [Parapedobacter sp.]